MVFDVVLSTTGWATYQHCVEYLLNSVGGYGNVQAAQNFIKDFDRAINVLKHNAASFAVLDNPDLAKYHFRKIHFDKLSYKILYRVLEKTVSVDFILHDRQNIDNIKLSD